MTKLSKVNKEAMSLTILQNPARFSLLCLTATALFSCAGSGQPALMADESFELTYPVDNSVTKKTTGSIFDNGAQLYPAGRSYAAGKVMVGDIVTIILNESAQASRVTGLSTERTTSNDVIGEAQRNALFPAGEFFSTLESDGSSLSSSGTGTAGQSASLTGSISAVVVDVMQNGNLIVFGEKQLELNEGSEYIRVRGVIRPEDIQPNNTVLSRRLANAQFSYSGAGELARATKGPWGIKALYGLWPF